VMKRRVEGGSGDVGSRWLEVEIRGAADAC
jgi:hypothetical protein